MFYFEKKMLFEFSKKHVRPIQKQLSMFEDDRNKNHTECLFHLLLNHRIYSGAPLLLVYVSRHVSSLVRLPFVSSSQEL